MLKHKKLICFSLIFFVNGLFANDPFLQRMEEIAKIRNGESNKEEKVSEKSSEEIMLEMKEAKAKLQTKEFDLQLQTSKKSLDTYKKKLSIFKGVLEAESSSYTTSTMIELSGYTNIGGNEIGIVNKQELENAITYLQENQRNKKNLESKIKYIDLALKSNNIDTIMDAERTVKSEVERILRSTTTQRAAMRSTTNKNETTQISVGKIEQNVFLERFSDNKAVLVARS